MNRVVIAGILTLSIVPSGCGRGNSAPPAPVAAASRAAANPGALPAAFDQTIPGVTTVLHMMPIPALPGGARHFFMSSTEVPWDVYDAFALRLDDPEKQTADVITRPSKPYLPPDHGWGHAGYPAM